MARWESKFCQEEVRLSKTRHEARGTHEALARRTTTNPLGGGKEGAHGAGKKRGRRRRRQRRDGEGERAGRRRRLVNNAKP